MGAMAECHALTRRESQTLWFACLGFKNSVIAERLEVSLDTVRLHIRNLHRKTRTADKVDLVREAWRFCRKQKTRRLRSAPAAPSSGRRLDSIDSATERAGR